MQKPGSHTLSKTINLERDRLLSASPAFSPVVRFRSSRDQVPALQLEWEALVSATQ